MKNKIILGAFSAFLLMQTTWADVPNFEQYSVNEPNKIIVQKIKFNAKSKKFKILLTDISKQDVNFAGYYVLDSFGCGGGCQALATYNAQTGAAFLHPQNFSDCYSKTHGFIERDYEIQKNSRLLVVTGSRTAKAYQCEKVYYLVEKNQFKEIAQHWIYQNN